MKYTADEVKELVGYKIKYKSKSSGIIARVDHIFGHILVYINSSEGVLTDISSLTRLHSIPDYDKIKTTKLWKLIRL